MKNIKYYSSIQECLGDKTAMSPNVALVEGCSNEDQLVYTDIGEVPIRFYEDSGIITGELPRTSFEVLLNDQWQDNNNLDIDDLDAYESFSNKGQDSTNAIMYIKIEGYDNFYFYIRSDAESTYDYVTVSQLDSSSEKMSTKGKQNSGTGLSSYTKVEYTNIPSGLHTITITYRKDSSQSQGTDRGYVLIPKYQ